MSKLRVAVLFGGVSSEHEVSLMSATSIINSMPKNIEVIKIGITKKGRWFYYPGDTDLIESGAWESHEDNVPCFISPDKTHHGLIKLDDDGFQITKVDAVFPALHGKNGEDGTVQGLCTLAGLPFVGCDMLSSGVCMDKDITKTILDRAGIAVSNWELVTRGDMKDFDRVVERIEKNFPYPVFVKPSSAGSSVGVNKVTSRDDLKAAMNIAFIHDKKVLVEQAVVGRECEISVLGNTTPETSVVGEIIPAGDFYDYDAKYILGTSGLEIPAKLDDSISAELTDTAKRAYMLLGCEGMARIDFFVDKDTSKVILNEVNTIPGFTSISMYPKLFDAAGISYSELLERLITLAIERNEGLDG